MPGFGNIRGDRDPRPVSPIILFTGIHDSGPCESGSPSAFCPHCGSGGRYVWTFVCEDGTRRGAMRGCLDLFPQRPLAKLHLVALERIQRRMRDHRTRRLASWDLEIEGVTYGLDHGSIGIEEAQARIQVAIDTRSAHLSRRFGKRRR